MHIVDPVWPGHVPLFMFKGIVDPVSGSRNDSMTLASSHTAAIARRVSPAKSFPKKFGATNVLGKWQHTLRCCVQKARSKPNVCLRMHKDINIYISWCCRFGSWTCECNNRCLAKRRSLEVRNVQRFEESLNLRGIHANYRPMPKQCPWSVGLTSLPAGAAKVVSQSLTVLRARISGVVSSRYFFFMGCSV